MVYFSMGHTAVDYAYSSDATNRPLSSTLGTEAEDRLIVDALLGPRGIHP